MNYSENNYLIFGRAQKTKFIAVFWEPIIPIIINQVSQKISHSEKGVLVTEIHFFWTPCTIQLDSQNS